MYKKEEESESDDDLDEFEASADDSSRRKQVREMLVSVMELIYQSTVLLKNKPHDEAMELSQDLSVAESFDGRGGQVL